MKYKKCSREFVFFLYLSQVSDTSVLVRHACTVKYTLFAHFLKIVKRFRWEKMPELWGKNQYIFWSTRKYTIDTQLLFYSLFYGPLHCFGLFHVNCMTHLNSHENNWMFKLLSYRKLLKRKTVISEIALLNVMKSSIVIVSYCLGAAKWSKPKVGTTAPSPEVKWLNLIIKWVVNYITPYDAKKCSA